MSTSTLFFSFGKIHLEEYDANDITYYFSSGDICESDSIDTAEVSWLHDVSFFVKLNHQCRYNTGCELVDTSRRNALRNDKKEGSIFNVNLLSMLISWSLDFISAFFNVRSSHIFQGRRFKKRTWFFQVLVCEIKENIYFLVHETLVDLKCFCLTENSVTVGS